MTEPISRRDFIKATMITSGGLLSLFGIGRAIQKVGDVASENARQIDSQLDIEYKAKVVAAEENLSKRVQEKFGLPFINSSFAVECRGTTLSNFVLAPKSDDHKTLAIYTDLGGKIVELVYNPFRSTPNMEWHRRDLDGPHDPVLSYRFTKETVGTEVNIYYRPPTGMVEKIGYQEKENNFHFSSRDLPQNVQQQLGLI